MERILMYFDIKLVDVCICNVLVGGREVDCIIRYLLYGRIIGPAV